MSDLTELTKALKTAFDSKDYSSCKKLFTPIKIELIKAGLLVPDLVKVSTSDAYVNDLVISRTILEIGALCSVNEHDSKSFENFFAQLRVFYFSTNKKLSESENKSKLISLYLLVLLSQGEVTKFHSELEFLSKHISSLEEDEYFSYPIKVEKWLMEGSYQKAWDLLQSDSKVKEFNVFTETLMDAIREEIARNTEMAYNKLPLFNVKALLFFKSEKDTEQFANERGWNVVAGSVIFNEEELVEKEEQPNIVERTLDYAINLESIV